MEREREIEIGFEFGARAPTVATGIDIDNCFVNGFDNGCDNGFVNGCDNGLFEYGLEYGLEAPYGAFFRTIICGFGDNIIAGLTAIAVTTVTRIEKERERENERENENNGVICTPNATNNIEEGKG